MKSISKRVLDDFQIPTEKLRKYKEDEVTFSGEICYHCKIYVNVPRLERYWKCYNCETENKFDTIHITLPFLEPDAGPGGRRLEIKNMEEYYNGEFW